jgi:carbon-monoxide dehydrogenase medium subunit
MIPAPFEYLAPRSLEEALRLLERHGDEARLLAGGQSLLPLMKLRMAAPRYLVALGRIKALRYIRDEGERVAIGALATHSDLETSEVLRRRCPLLAETAAEIGDLQVRNRGTLGGSLAHADPAADYPAAVLALEAELVASSSAGTRTIAAGDFFVDMMTTRLRPGEILTEVRLPALPQGSGWAYRKLHQPASGFALVGVAVRVRLERGRLAEVAIGVTGLGPRPFRATAAEQVLVGRGPAAKLLAEAAAHVADGVEPLADLHASADYRRAAAIAYARQALEAALARAQVRVA